MKTTRDAVKERQRGKVMYEGKSADDDLFDDDGVSEARGYRFSRDGFIIQSELSDEDWRNILPEIKAMQTAYQLNYGDWMVYGFERGYQVTYETMAEMTGMNPQTIEVYTSVCRNVPQLMRVNSLKFGHYRIVSKLPDDEKIQWIQFAAHRNLSTRTLQDLVALSQLPRLPETASDTDNTTIAPAVEPVPPASPAPEQKRFIVPPSPIKDREHRERMTTVYKKVAEDTLTDDDLQDVVMVRKWCDMVLEQHRQRPK